ncbi:hypothetical protein ACFODL_04765 [Phenylobacterium terrae]|uniref:Uncharacterized protein n=1 Tax=Phenylobacterium terrae TaxID=2665495 RepID=A0ABW4MVA7_9CAUL
MGGWSISLAICALICLGMGVGGRLDARTTGWLFLGSLLFLSIAVTVHVSAMILKERRRR